MGEVAPDGPRPGKDGADERQQQTRLCVGPRDFRLHFRVCGGEALTGGGAHAAPPAAVSSAVWLTRMRGSGEDPGEGAAHAAGVDLAPGCGRWR